jgi:hypothetical protein
MKDGTRILLVKILNLSVMKNNLVLLIGWAWLFPASAQKIIEKHIGFSKKDLVVLNIPIADSIKVLTWNRNEVYIKASIDVNNNRDNDLYKMVFGDSGSTVGVIATLDYDKTGRDRNDSANVARVKTKVYCEVYVPENIDFSVESINANIIITGRTAGIRRIASAGSSI